MKKLKEFVKPIIRGAVKTIPFGNLAVEVGTSIKESIVNKKTDSSKPLTHDWKSMLIQVVGLAAIVYCFYTKTITIDQLLSMIGF